jgi:cysteine rich repeat protein
MNIYLRLLSRPLLALALLAAPAGGPATSRAETEIPPEMRAQVQALAKICKSDVRRLCGSVQPGGGRIIACLRSRQSELGGDCRSALAKAEEWLAKAPTSGASSQ